MIGAGAWSQTQLTAWEGVENAEVVALCDRHPERRRPMAEQFNIPHEFDDVQAMLDEAKLDFVDICTRPYSHAPLARLAAQRGLPVLCQKPFCTSLKEARELVEFFREANTRIMVNENYRWQAWYRKIKDVLASSAGRDGHSIEGSLGRIFMARLHKRGRVTIPKIRSRQAYMAEMPRLIIYEMGVHYLDTFRFLFGDPETIYARTHHISSHIVGEDVMLITLGYGNMTAQIDCSWASRPVPGLDRGKIKGDPAPIFEIDGAKGTLILTADNCAHLFSDSGDQQWEFPQNTRQMAMITAQQHFINCLESGEEFETSAEDYLKTMALVYSCYLSAKEGRVVRNNE